MATEQETAELEDLQEQVLQRDLSIFQEDKETPLTADELRAAIAEYDEAQLRADERKPTTQPPLERPKPAPVTTSPETPKAKAQAAAKAAPKAKAAPAPKAVKSKIPSASPELLSKLKLGEPSAEDFALAEKHGYPVAIPGAKAYETTVSFWDVFAAREHPTDKVVLLTDDHARNKREYLTSVRD